MEKLIITPAEAGQRADKFLTKYLSKAPKSFIYKMLRKKNIKLNGTRCDGGEKLNVGDELVLFLAPDTVEKFRKESQINSQTIPNLNIIYENEHVLFINKPIGVLSQKAKKDDVSLVEMISSYLQQTGALSGTNGRAFSPGVCNRLDRNTSGIIIAGKTHFGLQAMSERIKDRQVHKYYLCIVAGTMKKAQALHGYLQKDEKSNQVRVFQDAAEGRCEIHTEYQVVKTSEKFSLLKVNLITGKTHQIRAHLASIGHPIIGDSKYGSKEMNQICKSKWGLKSQFLHAFELVFEGMPEPLGDLDHKTIRAELPDKFKKIVDEIFPDFKEKL